MRRKARAFPEDWDVSRLGRIWTIRAFDEHLTAPHHGFEGASDYYHRASAMRVIDRVRDPGAHHHRRRRSVRAADPFRDPTVTGNPHITTIVTSHGGHCGFVAEANGYDGYWAERTIVEFVNRHM